MEATNPDGSIRNRTDMLARAVYQHGQAARESPNTNGSRQGWSTPQAHDAIGRSNTQKAIHGSKHGCRCLVQDVKIWATPRSGKTTDENPETWQLRNDKGAVATMPLGTQVKAWATPRAEDSESCGMRHGRGVADTLTAQTRIWPTPRTITGGAESQSRKQELGRTESGGGDLQAAVQTTNGKLNPRWVETLMGLPAGWVMPSCKSPVTIELTNSDCSETEWCQPPPTKHFSL